LNALRTEGSSRWRSSAVSLSWGRPRSTLGGLRRRN
jgi:hypothetical protein